MAGGIALNVIGGAADLLAAARTGAALPGLPEALRPDSMAVAEAIQTATLFALRAETGGWKVGRLNGEDFSCPIPASGITAEGRRDLALPPDRFIELELALSFRVSVTPAEVGTLAPDDLTRLAALATLFEFVRPRFLPTAQPGPLDRIADCMANQGAMLRATLVPWTLRMLDEPPVVTLWQDGAVISRREAPHMAAPVAPMLEAWIARLRREGRGIAAGDFVTLGSLSGMPPIPAAGASYRGEIEGLEPVLCTVAPVG